jgi:hypothetical protein
MSLLWTGVCRIYFKAYAETLLYWSVDNGDPSTEVRCQSVVMTGNFETIVAPEQKAEPREWFCFKLANVYEKLGGVIAVTECTTASLRDRSGNESR